MAEIIANIICPSEVANVSLDNNDALDKTGHYFHSQNLSEVLPFSSTSYSKTVGILLSPANR